MQTDHPLVTSEGFRSVEECVLHLIHRRAYESVQDLVQDSSVLDWGCNDGYGLEILSRWARQVAGLDTGPHCIDAAQRRLPAIASRIRLYSGGVFPFPSETFDVIVSFQVIEHVADYDSYLSGIASALTPEGTAVFTTPNRNLRLDPGMSPWNKFHVTEFSPEGLRALLQQYFAEVRVLGLQGDPVVLDIERQRCSRNREYARQLASGIHSTDKQRENLLRMLPETAKVFLRAALPERGVAMIRRFTRAATRAQPAELPRFTTAQLYYSEDSLADAVDLMAVCKLRSS